MTGGRRTTMTAAEIRRAMDLLAMGGSISAVARALGRHRKVIARIALEGEAMIEQRSRHRVYVERRALADRAGGYCSARLCPSRHFAAQGRLTDVADSRSPPTEVNEVARQLDAEALGEPSEIEGEVEL